LRLLAIGLICILSSGCATVLTRSSDKYGIFHKHGAYPATQLDAELISSGTGEPTYPLLLMGCIIDLPLSATFDTFLLPYDLIKE
jgi:uncharacterized protein YceK